MPFENICMDELLALYGDCVSADPTSYIDRIIDAGFQPELSSEWQRCAAATVFKNDDFFSQNSSCSCTAYHNGDMHPG